MSWFSEILKSDVGKALLAEYAGPLMPVILAVESGDPTPVVVPSKGSDYHVTVGKSVAGDGASLGTASLIMNTIDILEKKGGVFGASVGGNKVTITVAPVGVSPAPDAAPPGFTTAPNYGDGTPNDPPIVDGAANPD